MSGDLVLTPLPMEPQPCPYVAGLTSRNEHYLVQEAGGSAFGRLVETGFRHFGQYFFRPVCRLEDGSPCGRCVPIRVPTRAFRPSKSQRRVARRGEAIMLEVGRPEPDEEKFEMYCLHKRRFHGRTVDPMDSENLSAEDFARWLSGAFDYTWECRYRLGERLVAVTYLDLAPGVASSVYGYFHPEFSRYSPGTLSILREIEYARRLGCEHYYLGYTMKGNAMLRYKMDFRPAEVYADGRWQVLRGVDGRYRLDAEALRCGSWMGLDEMFRPRR